MEKQVKALVFLRVFRKRPEKPRSPERRRGSGSVGPSPGASETETVPGEKGRSAGIDPEFGEHDGDDMVPVVEEEPLQERGKLLEERDPGAGTEAESPVAGVQELEGRVQEEGEDVEGGQDVGQVAFSVPEVVLETVSPDLEGLDVLVFDLPSGPSRLGQRDERVFGEGMIGVL